MPVIQWPARATPATDLVTYPPTGTARRHAHRICVGEGVTRPLCDDETRHRDSTEETGPQRSQAAGSLFETSAWYATLAATCSSPQRVPVELSAGSGTARSTLPLWRLGGGEFRALSNFYSPIVGPVRPADATAEAHVDSYVNWLVDAGASHIVCSPIDAASGFWNRFEQSLRDRGFWCARRVACANWHHPCQGVDWAAYLAARPSRLRNTIVRTQRKLARDAAVQVQVLSADTPAERMSRAVAEFEQVYARSWKQPEPFPNFIATMTRMAHARGWLRLGVCRIDGQAVAAQIWLVHAGVASIFKLAYDEAHASRGVGTAVTAALMEHVLDSDRVGEVDFLTGDDAYKAEWMSQRRERSTLVAFNPRTLRGLALASRHFGGQAWRRLRAQWPAGAREAMTP